LTFFSALPMVRMMKVILAGYNVDSEVIEELKKLGPPRDDITPETLSAAYARISRDPRPADVLRAVARSEVQRARRSNRNIIFNMGHHSVAEHAVFNFDIIGASRLALEELERFRLCSFTEKSQRYISLRGDYVLPEEVKKAGMEKVFVDTIQAQNALYRKLYGKLKSYFFGMHPEMAQDPRKHALLNGRAQEDARYVVSLSTQGQVGMTLNARNLELLIRRFSSHKSEEIRELNRKLYEAAKGVAPSIILFTEANDFDALTYDELAQEARKWAGFRESPPDELVRLVHYTPGADDRLAASLLHRVSSLSYTSCLKKVKTLPPDKKRAFLLKAFEHMEFFDSALREFEFVDLTFDLVVSAACFAQLKRHRMATLAAQDYDPFLGVTVPVSVEEVGCLREFLTVMERTNEVYAALKAGMDHGAEYILTNAHRRRVLLKLNARELYHISRLREDATAQWDIRSVARKMSESARKVMPLTCLMIGGKDEYPRLYREVFGRNPEFLPPEA